MIAALAILNSNQESERESENAKESKRSRRSYIEDLESLENPQLRAEYTSYLSALDSRTNALLLGS